jgi:hypothetical protein
MKLEGLSRFSQNLAIHHIFRQSNPIHTFVLQFSNNNFNIILKFTGRSSRSLLKFMNFSHLPYKSCMSYH